MVGTKDRMHKMIPHSPPVYNTFWNRAIGQKDYGCNALRLHCFRLQGVVLHVSRRIGQHHLKGGGLARL